MTANPRRHLFPSATIDPHANVLPRGSSYDVVEAGRKVLLENDHVIVATPDPIVVGPMEEGSSGAITQTSTGAVITYVSNNPNAIGYASFGDVTSVVKTLQVDGIAPSVTTIKDKTYKIQRPFLMITKGQPTNPVAKAFIDYVLGSEGQSYLASKNLVPVSS